MSDPHLPIFVYGTLQRGEGRERMWPAPALKIEPATIQGRLFDLGPYPALADGADVVAGELWHVRPEDLTATLEVLDAIECYGRDDVDLYVRRIVECRGESGDTCRAYTYFFANPAELHGACRVQPGEDGVCRWRQEK